MQYTIGNATTADIDEIFRMGTTDPGFAVSQSIRFYEKSELFEWVANSENNVLLVARHSSELAGFLFCKIMSSHWAMLDNFYISNDHRNGICSSRLFDELKKRLIACGISYLSTLIRKDAVHLSRYARKAGFVAVREFVWHEFFLLPAKE